MPFQIIRNDITKMKVDAIVNAANPMPGYGAGVDTAVYQAAGEKELLAKRQEIGTIKPGTSAITPGYGLPAKYIIHTAGAVWQGGNAGEEEIIRSCYKSAFQLAAEHEIKSLAIPLLASGHYGFPKGIALRIALSEIERCLAGHDMEIFLVVFDRKAFSLSAELYGDIDAYINDNYAAEQEVEESGRHLSERQNHLTPPLPAAGRIFRELTGGMAKAVRDRQASRENPKLGKGNNEVMAELVAAEPACKALAARSLDDVVKNLDKTFMELVFSFADAKGMSDVEVQKKANLDRKAFSKLKCGTTKNPSKATALALAIALRLNLDDTRDLLSRAGLALSPCSRQDVIVQYFIEREAYDIYEINVALFEHGEPLLGTQAS